MRSDTVNKFIIVIMVVFISAVFLSMIKSFLMAIFLAGIFSALARPIYVKLNRRLNGRIHLSAIITLVLILMVVVMPFLSITGVVTNQAIKVSQSIMPWVKKQIEEPDSHTELLEKIPYYDVVMEYREPILAKAGEMVGHVSQFLINNLSSVTMGAAHFLFMLFIWLYAMYFFLLDGDKLMDRILYYLPMKDEDEQLILDRFTSVAQGNAKGHSSDRYYSGWTGRTGVMGCRYSGCHIIAAVAALVVLSIIPGVGQAIVWVPAAVSLGHRRLRQARPWDYSSSVGLWWASRAG